MSISTTTVHAQGEKISLYSNVGLVHSASNLTLLEDSRLVQMVLAHVFRLRDVHSTAVCMQLLTVTNSRDGDRLEGSSRRP